MIVIAGPPGSGKSSAFPLAHFDVDHFNADDVAATLNGGCYVNISPEIRQEANRQFEQFIADHIRDRESFAIEATLRTHITFRQAHRARANGFVLVMYYVAVGSASMALERVANRAEAGGHSASVQTLQRTYHLSMGHLPVAIRQFDHIFIYDNTTIDAEPRLVLESHQGAMHYIAAPLPRWLRVAIKKITALKYER